MKTLNRRDFLKLASVTGGALLASGIGSKFDIPKSRDENRPNIIIIVFDAMSARNLSLYGYPRNTTPNLERFAQRANVYHSHYAAGSFTTPGTASLLTGTYPWTHRAINLFGVIERDLGDHNLFSLLGDNYHRLAFSQNLLPNYFLEQFSKSLDTVLSPASFGIEDQLHSFSFGRDRKTSYRAQEFLATEHPEILPRSLLFGSYINYVLERKFKDAGTYDYPLGIPQVDNAAVLYTLPDLMDGLADTIESSSGPFAHYYHLMAPHDPYRPDRKFHKLFDQDGYISIDKSRARFDTGYKQKRLDDDRNLYDAFIANLDFEFGKLLIKLEQNGVFENSYVIVTSDHGEMFERGVYGHLSSHLYEPGIHIPLLISIPGQGTRKDFYVPTNNVDILPTIIHGINGTPFPGWCEGRVLPGLGGVEDMERSTFTVEAKSNAAFRPLTKATFAMRRGVYKLTYYTGYDVDDFFEFYDVDSDPEELINLYPSTPSISKQMKQELLETIYMKNQAFM